MPDVLIRGLDETTHAELKRRSEAEGMSLQAYITGLLSAHVRRPTMKEWLQRLDELLPVEDVSGAEAVAAGREDLP